MKRTEQKYLEEVLARAYNDHNKKLLQYARAKVKNPDICEDLVQTTYMKTWSYLVKKGNIDCMKGFLYHTLKALVIDEYRKYKSLSLDILLENGFELHDEAYMRTGDIFDGEKAIKMIDSLPKDYQKVMHMRFVQGLSLSEMSDVMGKTNNSIAVTSHRGLEKLKILYKQ